MAKENSACAAKPMKPSEEPSYDESPWVSFFCILLGDPEVDFRVHERERDAGARGLKDGVILNGGPKHYAPPPLIGH